MPTVNPRLTVTLQPQVHAVLRRLSELTGNSQSALIAELMEQSVPVFEKLLAVLEAARKLKEDGERVTEQAKDEIVRGMERAQKRIEQQASLVFEDMDEGFRPVLVEAERINRRRGRSGIGAADPVRARRGAATPLSNRGVRSPQRKGKAKK